VLIDAVMPRWDGTRVDHCIVAAAPERVYDAALRADFARAFDESAVARGLTSLRTALERGLALATGRPHADEPAGEAMTLAGMGDHGRYVLLGEDRPREVCFGMIGRFWGGETSWIEFRAADFATFDRPGLARIACSLSFREYGTGRTLVSYESRTQATDAAARRAFLRYWRVAGPLAGYVLRAQLALIAREAEA
jgi:hypothetical protein